MHARDSASRARAASTIHGNTDESGGAEAARVAAEGFAGQRGGLAGGALAARPETEPSPGLHVPAKITESAIMEANGLRRLRRVGAGGGKDSGVLTGEAVEGAKDTGLHPAGGGSGGMKPAALATGEEAAGLCGARAAVGCQGAGRRLQAAGATRVLAPRPPCAGRVGRAERI